MTAEGKYIAKCIMSLASVAVLTVLYSNLGVQASPSSDFTQTINAGTLTTDIRDATRGRVRKVPICSRTKTSTRLYTYEQ